jgi:predicted nucleic acid-binding protein
VIVVLDATVLLYFLDDKAKPPKCKESDEVVEYCRERVEYLIACLQANKAKIVIPAPVLAEVLVGAGNSAPEWLRILTTSKNFRLVPFDERAAIEFAATQGSRSAAGAKSTSTTWAQAKFDAQIMAIAAVEGAVTIHSDDSHIKKLSGTRFEVFGIEDLPLPPDNIQASFEFPSATTAPEEE